MAVRSADFAGSWYPRTDSECRRMIEEFARAAAPCPSPGKAKFGGIVPHAGWVFSGKVAFNVIICLKSGVLPDTIVIFGRHLHPGSRNYIFKQGSWETPLGNLEIDNELGDRLVSEFSFVVETSTSYEQDNTIELQLPFIKHVFPRVKILPIGVPPSRGSLQIGERVAEIGQAMGRQLAVIGSTDLTHYGYNYGFTPKGVGKEAVDWVKNENDKRVVDLMVNMDAEGVINEASRNFNACCSGAAASAIAAAKRLGAKRGEKIIYTTSYDVRPDSSFVGYVGIVFPS
ncbi:MAG: AmmeMemoRadiSam system protein B [Deltaproteobacteria bacterium]|nr:AmmeMemoRadiSam system protein B [Deltaproteobacteria bacterium]